MWDFLLLLIGCRSRGYYYGIGILSPVPQAKAGYIYQHFHKDGASTEQTLEL